MLGVFVNKFRKRSQKRSFSQVFIVWVIVFSTMLLANTSFAEESSKSSGGSLSLNNSKFIEIKEMIVPVIQRRKVRGFFSIILALEFNHASQSEDVDKYLPIVRDRFYWDLYSLLGVIWHPYFRVDVKQMKERLLKKVQGIVGKDKIKDVLVISFQQHERRNLNR